MEQKYPSNAKDRKPAQGARSELPVTDLEPTADYLYKNKT
jgi:hypothetical protein